MSGRYASQADFEQGREGRSCATDGHIWGPGEACVFCKFSRPFPHNPRKLSRQIVSILVSADRCAKCLGELDTGLECNDCGFDWMPWVNASKEAADAAFDRREG